MKLGTQMIMALEPRLMFDGAAAIDAVQQASDDGSQSQVDTPAAKAVAFVDSAAADYQKLIDGLPDGVEVVVIDSSRSGLDQIAEWAASHSGYDTIHIFSHGAAGALTLGTDRLTAAALDDTAVQADLSALGQALTADGDVMLYGCSVAADASGQAFLDKLATVTGADVAASDDATGAAALGGDWVLEKSSGTIDSAALAIDGYDATLAQSALSAGTYDVSGYTSGTTYGTGATSATWTPPAGGSLENWKFDAAGTGGTATDIRVQAVSGDNYLLFRQASGTLTSATLSSADGGEFKLTSFKWQNNTVASDMSITITGYRDGVSVGSTTSSYVGSTSAFLTVTFGTLFENVDSIVITGMNGVGIRMDSLVVEAAVLPNASPTVTTPTTVSYTDTSANDSFSNTTGTLSASDSDGTIASYGISGGTTGGSTVVGATTYDVSKAGTYGTLYVKSSTGEYVYVPNATAINAISANQSETFTVTATDNGGASGNATLTVNLTGASDTPTLTAPSAATYTDTAADDTFTNTTGTLAGADRDTGATLTYGVTGGTTGGSDNIGGTVYDVSKAGTYGTLYVKSSTGEYVYVPNATAINGVTGNQSESFTVSVSDGGLSATQSLAVNITGTNDTPGVTTPTAVSYTDTSAADTFTNTTGTLAATDRDGTIASYGITGGTTGGSTNIGGTVYDVSKAGTYGTLYVKSSTGEYVYVPNATAINAISANQSETFTVTATDNSGGSGNATLTVNLTGANDAPSVTTPTTVSYTDTSAADTFTNTTGTLAASDSDGTVASYGISGGTTGGSTVVGAITYDVSKAGTYGTLYVKSSTGEYVYVPNATAINAISANQSETFTVTATDNGGASGNATLTVNLTGANDAPTLTATGGTATYTEGDATGTALFSGVTVGDAESGSITQIRLTVTNVSDTTEYVVVDGTSVALTNGNSATTAANSYVVNVSVTSGTATVTITKAGNFSTTDAQTLVSGLKYRDSATGGGMTSGNRVVTLTQIQDAGGGTDSTTLSVATTVTVQPVNHAPTLTTTTATPSYTEDGAAVSLFSGTSIGIGIGDSSQSIKTITFTVSNVTDGASEIVAVDGTNVALTNGNSVTTAANGYSVSVSVAGGTATVTITKGGDYSVAAAQTLVNGLTYRNSSQNPTAATRVVTLTQIQDSGGTSGGGTDATTLTAHSDVTVVAVNDAPTLTATGSTTTYTEGDATGTALFSGVTVGDAESGSITQIRLTVTNVSDTTEYVVVDGTSVALTNGNSATTAANSYVVNVSVTSGTATVTITKAGNFSTTDAQTLVSGLKYRDSATGGGMTTGNRVVTLTQIQDAGGTANGGTDSTTLSVATTVTVQPVNHAPTLTTTTATPNYTEDGTAVSLFSGTSIGIGIGDSSQSIKTITFTVSNVTDGASEIVAVDGTNVALTNGNSVTTAANGYSVSVSVAGGTATVTITKGGDYSVAAAQTLVNGLTYRNSSQNPTAATRVVTLTQIQDSGGTSGGGTDATTLTAHSDVTVVAVNDAPTLTATGGTATVNTASTLTAALFSGSAASTVEAGQKVSQLTLTVSGLADGTAEQLQIDGTTVSLTNGTTGTTGANSIGYSVSVIGTTATVTLTKAGDLSAAETNAVVDGLKYQNTNANATAGNRVVTLTGVTDTGGTANGGVNASTLSLASTVTVQANDTPVVAGATVTGTTVTQQTVSGVQVTDTLTGGTYTVTLTASAAAGKINLTGVTPTAGANDSNTVTFTGTKAQVNTILATLKYTPSGMGSETITVSVADGGTSYIGGAKTGTGTVTVTIAQPVVDTPTTPPETTEPAVDTTPTADTTPATTDSNAETVTIVRDPPVVDKPADLETVVRDTNLGSFGLSSNSLGGGLGGGNADSGLGGSGLGGGGLGGGGLSGGGVGSGLGGTGQIGGDTGGGGTFQVALASRSPGGGDALVVNAPIRDTVIDTGSRLSVTIPPGSFAHTRADASVTLQATRANGAALPGWMTFNPRTGSFEGTPPPGFRGEVVVRVVARDSDGREAVQTFKIVVGQGGQGGLGGQGQGQGGEGQGQGGEGRGGESQGQPGGAPGRTGELTLPDDGKLAEVVPGRPSLSDQLREMSQEARLAKQAALFGVQRAKVA